MAADDESDALRRLAEGTARSTGEEFFQSLVRDLSVAVESAYAFVAERAEAPTRVRTLAFWGDGRLRANVEYDLAGTPCEEVMRGGMAQHTHDVQRRFPDDARRRHIVRTLEESKWVIEGPCGAAQILGLHPSTLRSRMKRLGIHRSNESLREDER